jgi:hypothetical protein
MRQGGLISMNKTSYCYKHKSLTAATSSENNPVHIPSMRDEIFGFTPRAFHFSVLLLDYDEIHEKNGEKFHGLPVLRLHDATIVLDVILPRLVTSQK